LYPDPTDVNTLVGNIVRLLSSTLGADISVRLHLDAA
jgi:hypothetical protein